MPPTPIVDCSLFFREEAMFRARLKYLKDVVDGFIVVESDRKHNGEPNDARLPGILASDPGFYSQFKILPVYHRTPEWGDNWQRVGGHREGMKAGAKLSDPDFHGVPWDSYVLISDMDEFPRRELLQSLRHDPDFHQQMRLPSERPHVAILLHQMFYYDLWTTRDAPWPGIRLTTAADMVRLGPEAIRIWGTDFYGNIIADKPIFNWFFPDAGWHFSYFGGVKAIQEKVGAIAESMFLNRPEFTDEGHLKKCITESRDLYNREGEGWYEKPPPADIPDEIREAFPLRKGLEVLEGWK